MPPAIKPPWHDLEFRRAATLMGHLRTKPKRKADYKKQIELVQNLKKAKRIAFYNRMKLKTGISEEELEVGYELYCFTSIYQYNCTQSTYIDFLS